MIKRMSWEVQRRLDKKDKRNQVERLEAGLSVLCEKPNIS